MRSNIVFIKDRALKIKYYGYNIRVRSRGHGTWADLGEAHGIGGQSNRWTCENDDDSGLSFVLLLELHAANDFAWEKRVEFYFVFVLSVVVPSSLKAHKPFFCSYSAHNFLSRF